MNAAEKLAEARTALEHDAHPRALDAAWRAASSAAQVGNAEILRQVVELARMIQGADQLRLYAEACLEDAERGTRPPSAFERLFSRDRRRSSRS